MKLDSKIFNLRGPDAPASVYRPVDWRTTCNRNTRFALYE